MLSELFPVEILVRNSKFPAAFKPSGFKNPAAVSGGHAAAKAVLVHSFSSGWLECPLHNTISFLGVQKYGFFSTNQITANLFYCYFDYKKKEPACCVAIRRVQAYFRCGEQSGKLPKVNKPLPGYFTGTSFSVATRKSQNFCTVSTFTRSSGECGERMVGPNEIMSQFGYTPPSKPHSNPA